ncbi:MAG: cupin domain-containing protein [Alphaproteobacteria bacterium]|nr:cupin domain-containing protein [Alphaproteobacteria bacterium]
MPKIDIANANVRRGTAYPPPHDTPCLNRARWQLGDAGGLNDFGVNLLELPPGAWSSQRHWHSHEDEFVYVLSGEVVLVTDDGEEVLRAGDCAAFPKGISNGHHLVNRSNAPVRCLEVGTRTDNDICDYPDIDMRYEPANGGYVHRDGKPYQK